MIAYQVDMLTYSVSPDQYVVGAVDPVVERRKSPYRYYDYCDVLASGGMRHTGNPNTDKVLYSYGGRALGEIEAHLPALDHVKIVLAAGGTFSRIDFAVTVSSSDRRFFTPSDFAHLIESGRVTGSHIARGGATSIAHAETGRVETVYVGAMRKRAKNGILRVYDKGVERGLQPETITRVELEERRRTATVAARRYTDGYAIGRLIQQRITVDDDRWHAIMGDDSAIESRYVDDTDVDDVSIWHWLCGQVAPALGRAIADDEISGADNLSLFWAKVEAAARRQRHAHNLKGGVDKE